MKSRRYKNKLEQHFSELREKLNDLGNFILDSFHDDRSLMDIWGWNFPDLNKHDLANICFNLVKNISSTNVVENQVNPDFISNTIHKIEKLKQNLVPYFFNGNGNQAIPTFFASINYISISLNTQLNWENVNNEDILPKNLTKKLRSFEAVLKEINPRKDELIAQINEIKNAYSVAQSLPIDMESLKESKVKMDSFLSMATKYSDRISELKEISENLLKEVNTNKKETDKLVDQCEEAYKITTTKGLAGAFDQKTIKLSWRMFWWVIGLLIALAIGAWLGSSRFETLVAAINSKESHWGIIFLDIILSVIGLAAPVWFAWLATKQINQHFRLSEDYSFKASVAKAYEGYRKEAARINPEFESRLFESALSRLEEAPLRLIETGNHGSPWHELFDSESIKNAINSVPEFKNQVIALAKASLNNSKIENEKNGE